MTVFLVLALALTTAGGGGRARAKALKMILRYRGPPHPAFCPGRREISFVRNRFMLDAWYRGVIICGKISREAVRHRMQSLFHNLPDYKLTQIWAWYDRTISAKEGTPGAKKYKAVNALIQHDKKKRKYYGIDYQTMHEMLCTPDHSEREQFKKEMQTFITLTLSRI